MFLTEIRELMYTFYCIKVWFKGVKTIYGRVFVIIACVFKFAPTTEHLGMVTSYKPQKAK